ncbi:MAG: hypothetical protein P0S96_01545 [Simkaniaceae bacterium]|nr:hypothetical protein [Candidatus Sacchlamyda saccharinae]
MNLDTALSTVNATEGAYCLATIGEKLPNDSMFELPFRVTCGIIGTYLCSKAGEKFLKIYAPEVIRKTVFSAALATIPYWLQHGNLEQRCSDLTSSFDCSVFGYTNTLVAVAASAVALYTIFSFADSTILKYNIDGTQIRFYEKGGELNYTATSQFYYPETGTTEECEESGDMGLPYREILSYLRSGEYELTLNRHSAPVLFKPTLCLSNELGDRFEIEFKRQHFTNGINIKLFARTKSPFTQSLGGVSREQHTDPGDFLRQEPLNEAGHEYSLYLFKSDLSASKASKNTLDKIRTSGNNLRHLNKFEASTEGFSDIPYSITLTPIHRSSRIDERVLVSEFYWGITLVGNKGTGNNHAQLVLEGVDNGSYFTQLADLNAEETINLKNITHKKVIQYCTRSRVWKIRRERGMSFLNIVKYQRKNYLPKQFSLWGADSRWNEEFSPITGKRADSCMTWAAKRLREVGVELPACEIRTVITPTSWYTQPNWIRIYQDPGAKATKI